MDSACLRAMATQMETAAIAFRQLADAQDASQSSLQAEDDDILDDDVDVRLDEPVSVLFFGRGGSNRILKAFDRVGIKTVWDLMQKSRWDILEVRNLGAGSLSVVEDALSSVDLGLRNEPEEAYLRRRAREMLASSQTQ